MYNVYVLYGVSLLSRDKVDVYAFYDGGGGGANDNNIIYIFALYA